MARAYALFQFEKQRKAQKIEKPIQKSNFLCRREFLKSLLISTHENTLGFFF